MQRGNSPDKEIYVQYRNKFASKSEDASLRRTLTQKRYRENRKKRLVAKSYVEDDVEDEEMDSEDESVGLIVAKKLVWMARNFLSV